MSTAKPVIYFAGSIRGGRQDAALYASLIETLGAYGTVLTEHVGRSDLAVMGEDGLTDKQIFDRDFGWICRSDIVVAEVTAPSIGVGWEIGIAQSMGKTVLCLYRPGPDRRLSAMVAGNSYPKIEYYHDIEEAKQIFAQYFGQD